MLDCWLVHDEDLIVVGLRNQVSFYSRTTTELVKEVIIDNAEHEVITASAWTKEKEKILVFAGKLGLIYMVNDELTELREVGGSGHGSEITAIEFSRMSTLLASCSNDYTIRIWECHWS